MRTVERNVVVQIENLKTHPSVAAALERGDLTVHGWTYKFESGGFDVCADGDCSFAPMGPIA